jgi:hypothetical protein
METKIQALIADWHRRCRQSQRLNYETGNLYAEYHYIVGIATIIVSAIVSSSFFSQNNSYTNIIGILSMLVGILTALQTFFRFSEKAEKYKAISAKYGATRRQLEKLIAQIDINKSELDRQLESIKTTMDDLAMNSLNIPSRIKVKQVKELDSKARRNSLFKDFDIKGNGTE